MPYFWMPSVEADDATIDGLSGSVEMGFDDILDYLDFAAMGRVEAWKGKWGLTFDGVFMNLSEDRGYKGSRGVTNFSVDVDARLGMADFGLAYRLFEAGFGSENEQRLTLEPYGGIRYGYLRQKIDLHVNIAGVGSRGAGLGGSEDWVEPFAGGRVRWDLNKKFVVYLMGDAGGFGIGSASDLLWQFTAGLNYRLSERTSLNAGYRIVDLDYSRGSGASEFGVDLQAKGPFLGMTILY
jgi:opacity protein-like surface antigen